MIERWCRPTLQSKLWSHYHSIQPPSRLRFTTSFSPSRIIFGRAHRIHRHAYLILLSTHAHVSSTRIQTTCHAGLEQHVLNTYSGNTHSVWTQTSRIEYVFNTRYCDSVDRPYIVRNEDVSRRQKLTSAMKLRPQ